MQITQKAIDYILSFLVYENEEAKEQIVYSATPVDTPHKIRIIPAQYTLDNLPLPDFSPILSEQMEGELVIQTDIVYNTFFFIARAEERINSQRDEHGRFLAKYSILGKKNRLQIPMLDEYARFLLKTLDLPLPKPQFSNICLTHDIDAIDQYRHLHGFVGGIFRGEWKQVMAACRDIHHDPAYTFNWMIEQDKKVRSAETIYFVKDTPGRGDDYPQYNLNGRDWLRTRKLLLASNARLGLHSSRYGFYGKTSYSAHRSHFLTCDIQDMQRLVQAGITDDYTMGFADQAGFRLQTTRPVRWIDPTTGELTPLTLHPLTVMDCTLYNKNYMNLEEDEAFFFCERLFDKVKQNGGELVLLWHNTNTSNCPFHDSLYPKLLDLITD